MAETFCQYAVTELLNWGGQQESFGLFFFFSIPQLNHTMSALLSSIKVIFTLFKVKLPTSSLFSLFCFPCYVTTSLILFPKFSKEDWSMSHQAFCGAWCVWAEFTTLCFIVTGILSQDFYCKHPFWASKSNQKDLSTCIRAYSLPWREITALEVNYGGKRNGIKKCWFH